MYTCQNTFGNLMLELGLWMNLWHYCYTILIVCSVQVEELVRLSLNHPVRLFVDSNTDVADNLRQEFVRIKSKKEGDREAIVTGIIIINMYI